MQDRPYLEDGDIRTFTQHAGYFELVWHRDKEDRYIEPLEETDWSFQFDNDTPKVIGKDKLFIPRLTYHRLIKGTGELRLRVQKCDND